MTMGLMTVRLEKRTTEESYDWYEAKSSKRASMAVSPENLTNMVERKIKNHCFITRKSD